MAHARCMLDKDGYMRAHIPTPTFPTTHVLSLSLSQTHTHTHTHTQQYVITIAFPRQQWFILLWQSDLKTNEYIVTRQFYDWELRTCLKRHK
jgi:hypothetical protein